jgi:hypothetical protein
MPGRCSTYSAAPGRRAGAEWDHPGAELARWPSDDTILPPQASDGALCLIMPWCTTESFAVVA